MSNADSVPARMNERTAPGPRRARNAAAAARDAITSVVSAENAAVRVNSGRTESSSRANHAERSSSGRADSGVVPGSTAATTSSSALTTRSRCCRHSSAQR